MNIHDKDNFSPLLLAACNGHSDTIETLLSCGANILDVDKNDKSALFWAAEEDHLEVMKVSDAVCTQQGSKLMLPSWAEYLNDEWFIQPDQVGFWLNIKMKRISLVYPTKPVGSDSFVQDIILLFCVKAKRLNLPETLCRFQKGHRILR